MDTEYLVECFCDFAESIVQCLIDEYEEGHKREDDIGKITFTVYRGIYTAMHGNFMVISYLSRVAWCHVTLYPSRCRLCWYCTYHEYPILAGG